MKSVYVISAGDCPIKLGIANDPSKRLRQISYPQKLTVQFALERRADARAIEVAAHKLLSSRRLNSEWFDASVAEAKHAIIRAIEDVENVARPQPKALRKEGPLPPGHETRETRERFGITAKALAAEACIARETLSAYETGLLRGRPYRRRPNRTTADAIERALTHLVDAVCRQKRS